MKIYHIKERPGFPGLSFSHSAPEILEQITIFIYTMFYHPYNETNYELNKEELPWNKRNTKCCV